MPSADLMTIFDEMNSCIGRAISAGFHPPESIVADVVELFSAEADAAVLTVAAKRMASEALRELLLEQAYWPAVTDCDRLDAAFAALERAGIVCRQNFACCGTCGVDEIWTVLEARKRDGYVVRGYVFYHQQDTEHAIEGDGLYLNFGALDGTKSSALAIASEVVDTLAEHGLRVEWNGDRSRRIAVALDWKRRRDE